MIAITEQVINGYTIYNKKIYDYNNILISEEIVRYKTVIMKRDNELYYMLYDTNICVVREVFRFLNNDLSMSAQNSREKYLHGLKLLHIFSYIINVRINEFSSMDIHNFIAFLQGKSLEGRNLKLVLKTERNVETVSGYLSACRLFVKYVYGNTNSEFLKLNNNLVYQHMLSDEYTHNVTPYQNRVMGTNTNILEEIPAYISVEEFWRIITVIRSEYSIVEECIVRLMFECGLRIGEVLGITSDDLLTKKNDDKYISYCELKNRISDEKYQNAKTCMKVHSVKDYGLKEYQNSFQIVILPNELFELIYTYIEKYHTKYRSTKKDNYYKYAVADRVRNGSKYEDVNFYIFLNTQGRRLSQRIWSETLRDIFQKANIKVDKKTKRHNLSHRFRHGFAVFHVQYMKTKILRLKELMRHRSLKSLERYYKLTIEDKIKIKDDFVNDLYTNLPELKSDYYKLKGINHD